MISLDLSETSPTRRLRPWVKRLISALLFFLTQEIGGG